MIFLGLDLSTTTCGWAFTENNSLNNKNILDCGFLDISKFSSHKEKAEFIISELDKKSIVFDEINLEAALGGWSGGGGNMQTVIKLARWNAVFEYILSENYNIKINLSNAVTMRKQILGKCFIKGVKPKDFVKEHLEKMYDLNKWLILNKKGNEDKRMSDIRDAIICSLYRP